MLSECDVTKRRDMNNTGTVFLDPDQKSPRAQDFEERLTARIVGQERAVRRMSGLYQIFLAGMNPPNRPIGMWTSSILFQSSHMIPTQWTRPLCAMDRANKVFKSV